MVYKNFWAYQFVSLAVPQFLAYKTTQNIPGGLLGYSKSTFMPGLPVNGKYGCSATKFTHISGCILLLLHQS
jgi:hypothetical protein